MKTTITQRLIYTWLLCITLITAQAQPADTTSLSWFRNAKFGLFLHWGLYSQTAGDWKGHPAQGGEHFMLYERIPLKEYARIADNFNPTEFDARQWAETARKAGMRYVIITAKHHDGFAMYNSPSSSYNIVTCTPWGKDPMKELAEACRREGLKFGFYYSLGRDWEDPDVPTNWPVKAGRSNTWDYPDEDAKRLPAYIERKVKPQLRELLTHYGPIDFLWFDTPELVTREQSLEIRKLIHSLQPQCLINSRIGNGMGDYSIVEQKLTGQIDNRPWEACLTIGKNWCYNRYDTVYKKPDVMIRHLTDIVSKGGNLLLNVGPDGKGRFPALAGPGLKAFGQWLALYGEAIYGTRPWRTYGENYDRHVQEEKNEKEFHDAVYDGTPQEIIPDFRYTQKDHAVYVIVRHVKAASFLLSSFYPSDNIVSVESIDTRQPVRWKLTDRGLQIEQDTAPQRFPVYVLKVNMDHETTSGDEQGLETGTASAEEDYAIRKQTESWWPQSMENHDKRMAWWRKARFGCFVHWGVYAQAGGTWKGKHTLGYSEHLMRQQRIPLQEYTDSLIRPFNPTAFDADQWMKLARDAGMRYFIITAKHHDGFAMFPSDAYPYDIRMTKMETEPMAELARAARKYGIRFGFYYSHAFDWEHPDAPGNDWEYENPGGDKLLYGAEWWRENPAFVERARKYVDQKAIPQLAELIHRYHPDILWFDTPHKLPLSENLRILQFIRETDPDIIVNGRLARNEKQQFGDYNSTGDRAAFFFPEKGDWESIPTTNESYGYNENDHSHKPASHFIRLLASATARGGNILMNVGPKGNGAIDEPDLNILRQMAQWMALNDCSVHEVGPSGLPAQSWGETTLRGDSLFLHVFQYPADGKLFLSGMNASIKEASFLASGEKIKTKRINDSDWLLQLPQGEMKCADTVIVVRKKGTIIPTDTRLLDEHIPNILLAFDARLCGEGWQHGDGKVARNYLSNWTSEDMKISWSVKNNKTARFEMILEYTGASDKENGSMQLLIDGKACPFDYRAEVGKTTRQTIATVCLKPGTHLITLQGDRREGREYLRPMSLTIQKIAGRT